MTAAAWRRAAVAIAGALLSLATTAGAQRPPVGADSARAATPTQHHPKSDSAAAADRGAAKPYAPRPLFASATPLAITLTADFGAIFKERDTLKTRRYPATLAFADEQGALVTLPVELSTRGHFRLKATTCGFPPLRVVFDKSKSKGTPFAGQRALKLVTHCRTGDRTFEQYVLREYVVYKVLNALTERSFRDRLARVTYVDTTRPTKPVTAYAFFVESEEELASRLGGRVITARQGRFDDFDPVQVNLVAVFEYFIGNTDWSLSALHNIRIVASDSAPPYPVPYDFDWSGLVHTHYAVPDARLPIKNVRERLYLGPCRSAAEFAPTLALFVARRDSIVSLYRSLRALDNDYLVEAKSYIGEFYDVIGDRRQWKHDAERTCDESN